MKNSKGFTLIEMAALLVLLGIMLAALLGLYTRSFGGRLIQTQANENIRGAGSITAFAQIYKYLPTDIDALSSIWRRTDIFGNEYEYIIAPELTGDRNICKAGNTTAMSVRYCEVEDCSSMTVPTQNIAFMLLSRGRNSTADYRLLANEYRLLRKKEDFDDLATYYTISELKSIAGCDNVDTDTNKLHFINSDIIPLIINGTTDTSAVIMAGGGVPFAGSQYDWCVDDYEPVSTNFYALDMLFYVRNGASTAQLKRIADSNCATDVFARGTGMLLIKYNQTATIDGNPASFYFTAHLKDNDGKYIKKRYLYQMYQK